MPKARFGPNVGVSVLCQGLIDGDGVNDMVCRLTSVGQSEELGGADAFHHVLG